MSQYTIEFTQIAIKTISKYKKSNPLQYKKLVKLLDEMMEHPRTGTGHPEPLKSGDLFGFGRSSTAPSVSSGFVCCRRSGAMSWATNGRNAAA